jgi:hypothetical protein
VSWNEAPHGKVLGITDLNRRRCRRFSGRFRFHSGLEGVFDCRSSRLNHDGVENRMMGKP